MDHSKDQFSDIAKAMKESAITFETHLTTLTRRNSELITSINRVQKEIKNLFGTIQKRFCNVCFENEINVVLQCGHVLCSRCADKAKSRGRCFTCRKNIEQVFKIYL